MVRQLILAASLLAAAGGGHARIVDPAPDLSGTWVMESAWEILADGRRVTNYGEHPLGLLIVDRAARYSLQIFRRDRPAFAAGEKGHGTPDEYRAAVLGSSTHFGRLRSNPAARQLIFDIEGASFPNWEGRRQVRDYVLRDGVLRYAVPASASGNGTTAWSIWRRVGKGDGDG
ncbi:lipocalin-like domain-containing protein [Sphingomonas psychrotolerans]|uniref:Lipocalin-like domain-containing protein n=1 Tax=Sphingomonas psychrotolerans TaxID=1327635 RepID=A0ABU3N170_9SPHN|nr:lipocalin-like domain-containing protein [Sphingomonas psychrotolerans]MDT8758123.1 lipocalin-like domain-containing protein [Sphingomonas psychrotolerans]